jgi:hypothetical protein
MKLYFLGGLLIFLSGCLGNRVDRICHCAERAGKDMGFDVGEISINRDWLGRVGLIDEGHLVMRKDTFVVYLSVYEFDSDEHAAHAGWDKKTVFNTPFERNESVSGTLINRTRVEVTSTPFSDQNQKLMSAFFKELESKMQDKCGLNIIGK